MAPYIVLATYSHPKVFQRDKWNDFRGWRCWHIGEELTALTKGFGLVPHKDPVHGAQPWANWVDEELHAECKRFTPEYKGGEDWHKDGDTTPGSKMDCAIVLWTSNTPTEFQFHGKIFQPKPFEVVLFKNLSCSHRRPPNAPEERYIFRQRVAVPKHIILP